MPEWLDGGFAINLIVSSVGLGLAFWQISRTKKAAKAAQEAIRKVSAVRLLDVARRLADQDASLSAVHKADARDDAMTILTEWIGLAASAEGLVEPGTTLHREIHSAVTHAEKARTAIEQGDSVRSALSLAHRRDAIAATTRKVRTHAERIGHLP